MVRHISELYRYEGKKSAYNLLIRAMVIPMQPIWVTWVTIK